MFPLLSVEFRQKLDPTYLKCIEKLEDDLKASEAAYKKREEAGFGYYGGVSCGRQKLLIKFAKQYMMPKELWDIYFNDRPVANHGPFKRLINLTHYHFYYNSNKTDYATRQHQIIKKLLYRKIMDEPEPEYFEDYSPEDFCYPHFSMNKRRNKYEEKNSSIIPTKFIRRHEAMKKLYHKIKVVEEDVEKWIETMLETGDIEFVEHNIEYRIGKDLTNKKLWKLYIQFLKEHDKKTLMQTYSKYIRFFMDDMDMKSEYQKALEAEKIPFEVLWKNVYSMEKSVEKMKTPDQCLMNRKRKVYEECGRSFVLFLCYLKKFHFNPKNAKAQKFSFRLNLIDYILINADACILRILFKTCKWFYIRNPATIFYKFIFKNFYNLPDEECWERKDDNITFDNRLVFVKDIYISTFLEIYDIKPVYIAQFVKRIYRCEARHIDIRSQSLTTAELQCFIGHGNVAKLEINNLVITDNKNFVLEDIVKLTPKIEYLSIYPIQSSPDTAKILSELPFQEKLEYFSISIDALEPIEFVEFIKKNMAPNSRVSVNFKQHNSEFRKIVAEAIKDFWKENQRPRFWY